jgi:hypothetical protein
VRRAFNFTACSLIGLTIGAAASAAAEEPASVERPLHPVQALTCPECLLRGCCDTHYPKPLPCLHCLGHWCGPDDYCSKPCPSIWCYHRFCRTDSYCRKPCPALCRPIAGDYFTCAEGSAACAESAAQGANSLVPSTPLQSGGGLLNATDTDCMTLPATTSQ